MAAISLLSQKISSLFLALQILGKYVFLCQMHIFLDSCTPHVIRNSQMFSFTPRNIIYQVIKKFFTSFPLKMFALSCLDVPIYYIKIKDYVKSY